MALVVDFFPRFKALLVRDIGAPIEGTIVSAAVVTVVGAHADRSLKVVLAWAAVLVVYWLTHVYLHALKDQLRRSADPLHRRLADHAGLQAGVLVGGVPVISSFLIALALGADQGTATWVALVWTIVQLSGTVFGASRAANLSTGRALVESAVASMLGLALVLAKILLH